MPEISGSEIVYDIFLCIAILIRNMENLPRMIELFVGLVIFLVVIGSFIGSFVASGDWGNVLMFILVGGVFVAVVIYVMFFQKQKQEKQPIRIIIEG